MLRIGSAGAERVLVDPGKLGAGSGTPHAINYFAPSWDGRTLAYGISAGGSEDASLHLMDIASGKALGEPIPRVREDAVRWAPDSRHLTYNQGRELPRGAPRRPKPFSTPPSTCSRPAAPSRARGRCSARSSTRTSGWSGSTTAASCSRPAAAT